MATVSRALERIKQDLDSHLPPSLILAACREEGHRWRQRKLGPVMTLHLFVLQVLHFNTAIRHLRHLIDGPLNAAAYCRARMRLPLAVLERLLRESSEALQGEMIRQAGRSLTHWRGHRTLLVDATGTITPDTPELKRMFGQPSGPKVGLPVPKVLGLFDAMTGLIVEVKAFALFVHESSKLWLLHPFLRPLDLLVGDCAYCSFAHLALLSGRRVHALFRMHQSHIVNFRPNRKHFDRRKSPRGRKAQKGRPRSKFVARLGRHDQIVRWIKPGYRSKSPKWMKRRQFEQLPEELELREIRYRVIRRGYRTRMVTLATTLLDPVGYPKETVTELYGMRWRVETHLRHLKITLKMRRLKCMSESGIRKELVVYALVYNLVHAVMMRAAAAQETTPDRISFIDTLRWLLLASPRQKLVLLVVNPKREGRYEPRVVKDYSTRFPGMAAPRQKLRAMMATKRRSLK
jgi:hypothetical protein